MTRARILLADDHRIVAEGLKSILADQFELIGVVEDGRKMVEAARASSRISSSPTSTCRLQNGIEALEQLRKEGLDIPVVFLTMHRDTEYATQALEAGAAGYVLKHAAPEELVQAVRVALEGGTFVSPALAGELFHARKATIARQRRAARHAVGSPARDPALARGRPFGERDCQGTRHIVSHGRIPQVQAHGVAWSRRTAPSSSSSR